MPTLTNYQQFDGLPWATGYLKNALAYQGVTAPHTGQPYSEALLMGINGGLCAGYFSFEYTGHLPHLHFLTRYLYDEEPGAVFERLAIPIQTQQTTNPTKAAANVIGALAQGKPAIVWADIMTLPYNNQPIGAGWFVMPLLVYGYQVGGSVQLADRARVPLTVSEELFAAARARLGKTRHRMMTISAPNADKLPDAVRGGIQSCIEIFSGKSPVGSNGNFGFNAYHKWAKLLTDSKIKESWAVRFAPGARMYAGLVSAYRYIEVFFTGGRGARHIYADFLSEAAVVLNKPALSDAAPLFGDCAAAWDQLTSALLPDHVPLLRETRELLERSYHLFLDQGGASLDERQQIRARLTELEQQAAADFPLSGAQAADLRAELATLVLELHDVEKVAISALVDAMK